MLKLALLRWQVLFPLALGIAVILTAWWAWNAWQRRPASTPIPVPVNRLHPLRPSQSPSVLPLPSPFATNSPSRPTGR